MPKSAIVRQSSVDTSEVSIKDVFPGAKSEAVIAKNTGTPVVRLILDAYTLQRIAKRHNIQWQARTPVSNRAW